MADKFTPLERSQMMTKVKSKDTKPEKKVRSLLHSMGYRFRLHRKDLPGKPDIVLPKFRKVIFVHGCFWHGHPGCRRASRPADNADFWNVKLDSNLRRDAEVIQRIEAAGWKPLVIWQCEIRDTEVLRLRLQRFLVEEAEETVYERREQ